MPLHNVVTANSIPINRTTRKRDFCTSTSSTLCARHAQTPRNGQEDATDEYTEFC